MGLGSIAAASAATVTTTTTTTVPTEQRRALVQAILAADAQRLYEHVTDAQPPLDQETAMALLRQAWLADVSHGLAGAPMEAIGLTNAIYIGLSHAQHGTDCASQLVPDEIECYDDNCITSMCALAIETDNADVIDALVRWDPSFRLSRRDVVSATGKRDTRLESTIAFFEELGAPRCAARLRQRRRELSAPLRVDYTKRKVRQRIAEVASEWAAKCEAAVALGPVDDTGAAHVCVEFLEDLMRAPYIRIISTKDSAFTLGFCLLGRPELVTRVGRKRDANLVMMELNKLSDRCILEETHERAGVVPASETIHAHPFLDPVLRTFQPLRPRGVRPYLLVRLAGCGGGGG